jgi:small subunit ribosomal protein S6
LEQDNWGLRQLAYPIRKFQEGTYMLTKFELDTQSVKELDRSLNASGDILRYLLMKI